MSQIDFDFSNVAAPPSKAQEVCIDDVCSRGNEKAEYTPPATRSASKRWKRIHEQSMMLRLNEMHVIKTQNARMSKEAARKIIRKIPVELLAKEWLSKEDATVDMRAYLVDHVLPTLILGVERLLKEVDEKGLSAVSRYEPDFNPLNFLAQYLMRNNPRYSNFAEASPYVRGLREVSEELKQELFTFEDNRLARIKAEARRKRTEREKVEQLLREEKERRQAQLVVQFREWNVPTDNNRVELSLLQNALMSFAEIAEQLPDELREVAKFGHPLEAVDETGRTLAVKEFAQYISLFVEDLPMEVFEQFMVHMSKCAAAHRASAERENRRIILTNLFILCDHGGIGMLDRHRILTLFEQYWDMMRDRKELVGTLRNPRRWPVVEVDEVDDIVFDDPDEDDGGLSASEMKMAKTQAVQVRRELNRDLQHSHLHDKNGQEKWKMELLSERSEEQRIKLYKFGPEDFMHVGDYTLFDTMEVHELMPRINPDDLFDYHDMRAMDLAKTAVHRQVVFGISKDVNRQIKKAGAGQLKGQSNRDSLNLEAEDAENDLSNSNSNANANVDREEEASAGTNSKGARENNDPKNDFSPLDKPKVAKRIVTRDARVNVNANQRTTRPKKTRGILEQVVESDDVGLRSNHNNSVVKPRKRITRDDAHENRNDNHPGRLLQHIMTMDNLQPVNNDTVADPPNTELVDNHKQEVGGNIPMNKNDNNPPGNSSNEMSTCEMHASHVGEEGQAPDTQKAAGVGEVIAEEQQQAADGGGQSEEKSAEAEQTAVPAVEGEEGQGQTEANGGATVLATVSGGQEEASGEAKKEDEAKGDGEKQEESQAKTDEGESGEVKKAEGETATEEAGPETSDDVTINVPGIGKESGGAGGEKGGEEAGKEGESVAETQEEFDVDITGEMAGRQTKSALKPADPTTQPTATGRISVTFAGNTAFDREKTGLTTTQSRSQSQMSAFDENILNVSQFVQLTETYLGHHPVDDIFLQLVTYLKQGYEETEEEKMERLVKARKEAISAKRKLMMDNLFEKWDNDGSGFLEMEDVQEVMLKYKDGQEHDAIKRAHSNLKKRSKYHDMRLSRREFRQFVELVVDELPGAESFEYFVEFLTNSVERSYAERIRGEARKKWLGQILTSAQTCGTNMDTVYKAVFHALYKDAEAHGGEKKISSSISMLERNTIEPARGDVVLRYAACTAEDCQYMLGKVLFQNQKGISWTAVESGKPVHVPRVANHGNIYFWNFDRMPEDREGSFIVVPLADLKKRVFGILGIDTMLDTHKKAIFITHEIQYFQGAAKAFSIAYHIVDMRRKLLRITESAISWIQRRCPHIVEISVYIVEPNPKEEGEPLLRKMMTTDKKGAAVQVVEEIRLERKDNLFRDYLFNCMDNSETVTADAYGQRHTASPLRDNEGRAIGVVDISIGNMRKLPVYENREAQRMLRLLQQAHKELTKEAEGDESTRILEAEQDDDSRMDIMFDRLMLMELRENVSRLDMGAFAELKSYNEPPQVIHDIIRATLAIFHLDKAVEGFFDDWTVAKNYISPDLIQQVKTYDPTVAAELVKSEKIEKYLRAVPHGAVAKHGSIPAQQLYNWVFVCISLIDHTRKMRENAEGNVMVASGEEADTSGANEGLAQQEEGDEDD